MLFDVVTVREAATVVAEKVVPTPSRWRSSEEALYPRQEVEGVDRVEVLSVSSKTL